MNRYSFLFFFSFLYWNVCFSAQNNKFATIAILPFECQASKDYHWLSSGITDSLIAKFSKVDGITVVEREKLLPLLEIISNNAKPISPDQVSLINADYLLLGSFSVINESIRINARVVSSNNSTILANAVFSCSGKFADIFTLQTLVAQKFASICSLEIPQKRISYSIGKTNLSLQLYTEGIKFFRKAKGSKYLKGKIDEAIDLMASDHAILKQSTELFVKAQQTNSGFFFPEAHAWEGSARIAAANSVIDHKQKKSLQQQHIDKFKLDSIKAAPAFYDLGIALQSTKKYAKAIKAYDDYLKWYDTNARPLRWEMDTRAHPIVKTEEAPYYFSHGKREREMSNSAAAIYSDNWRHWVANDSKIIIYTKNTLECRDFNQGTILWTSKINSVQKQWANRVCPQFPNTLIVRKNKVYWSSLSEIQIFDYTTGESINTISTGISMQSQGAFYVFDKEDIMLTSYLKKSNNAETIAHSISTGKEIWRIKQELTPVNAYHNGYFYTVSNKATVLRKIDLKNGQITKIKTFEKPIYQLWPHSDHLLVRCTSRYRDHTDDTYFKYAYSNNEITKETRNLFFNYFYNILPKGINSKLVPMMDKNSPFYCLIPASLFYPRNIVKPMDITDNRVFDSRYNIPSCRLANGNLFSWSIDRTILGYNITSKELIWKKSIADSSSLVDLSNHLVISKCGRRKLRVYSSRETPDSKRYIDAHIQKSICLKNLHQIEEAFASLNKAYNNSNDSVKACLTLAQTHHAMGNMNEAIEYYSRVTKLSTLLEKSYQEANTVLQQTIGLKKIIPTKAKWIRIDDKNIYYNYDSSDRLAIAKYDSVEDILTKNYIKEYNDIWRVYGNKIIYFDHENNIKSKDATTGVVRTIFKDSRISINKENQNGVGNLLNLYVSIYKDSILYVVKGDATGNNKLISRSLETGAINWTYLYEGLLAISTVDNYLVCGLYKEKKAKECSVIRLNPISGKELWKTSLDTTMQNCSHEVNDNSKIFAFHHNGSMVVSFINKYPYIVSIVMEPRIPYHSLNPSNGKLLTTTMSQLYNTWIYPKNDFTVLDTGGWSYGNAYHQNVILQKQWENHHSIKVTEADFHERHPAVLARIKPLAHLSNEYDLSKHVDVLNSIINNKEKRKAFIKEMLPYFTKRGTIKKGARMSPMGQEPLQNTLRLIIKRGNLNEKKEKFVARQLMSLGKNREPYADLRAFRYPSGCRFKNAVALDIPERKNSYAIGHYKGVLMGAYLNKDSQYITPWYRMPRLNFHAIYNSGISNILQNGKVAIVLSRNGIHIYNMRQLIDYMENNVQYKNGCFSVNTLSSGLEHAVDNNHLTYATVKGDTRSVIGIDFGVPRSINTLTIFPTKSSGKMLQGTYIQTSSFSETGKYEHVGMIENVLMDDKENTVKFKTTHKVRYCKLVIRNSQPINIAELKFSLNEL